MGNVLFIPFTSSDSFQLGWPLWRWRHKKRFTTFYSVMNIKLWSLPEFGILDRYDGCVTWPLFHRTIDGRCNNVGSGKELWGSMSIPLRRYLDSITNIYTLPTYLSTDDTAATEAADGATIDGTYVRKLQPLEKSNFLDIIINNPIPYWLLNFFFNRNQTGIQK